MVHGVIQRFILKEPAVLGSLGYISQLLIHDPAGSYVQMSDFRVSHLAVGKSNVFTGSVYAGERIFAEDAVQVRSIGLFDGIAVFLRIQPETVQYH